MTELYARYALYMYQAWEKLKPKGSLPGQKTLLISVFILHRNHSADDEIQKYSLC